MFNEPSVYDDLNPDEEVLRKALGDSLEFSSYGKSISVASLSLELRLLTMIMFHNLKHRVHESRSSIIPA